jgi:S1-C subfamily serine protease
MNVTIKRALAHPKIDVGLLEISPPFASLKGLAFREPRIGETVFTVGFPRIPLSREPSLVIQRDEVTNRSITTFSGDKLFLYSAIARPGNSGGPVISSDGNVVGLVTQDLREEPSADVFYAGVGGVEVARAISELDVPVTLPIEDYR